VKSAGSMESLIAYLGRCIEVALPLVLVFSLSCLGFAAFAERVYSADAALVWAMALIGATCAVIAMIFVAYLVVVRPDLLKRVKKTTWERVVPVDPGTAAPKTHATRRQ
jgi:hypothetical protein